MLTVTKSEAPPLREAFDAGGGGAIEMVKTDSEIRQAVLDELRWGARVDGAQVEVEVEAGVVRIHGEVATFMYRIAALEAAQRVAGVLDVVDDLHVAVQGEDRPTDAELARAVQHALTWDTMVPEHRIQTGILDGCVTLRGEVETLSEREDAERAVRNLRGIRGVINDIHIRVRSTDANAIRSSIERALERRAMHEGEQIAVRVEDGEVTLSGDVPSYSEQQAILQAAAHAPGVRSVKNELHIDLFA